MLRQGLSQQLRLTPQLQQAIRLLTLSRAELDAELTAAIESNPLLERDEDDTGPVEPAADTAETAFDPAPGEAAASDDSGPGRAEVELVHSVGEDEDFSYGSGGGGSASYEGGEHDPDETGGWEARATQPEGLHQHLLAQVDLLRLSPLERALAETLIGLMDEDGYLRESPEALAAELPPELNADPGRIETVRHLLQGLDPAGLLSRDLGDCFAAQLRALPEQGEAHALALTLAQQHLEALARSDRARLCERLGATPELFKAALALLAALNPRPAASYSDAPVEYVVPDVLVERSQGRWKVFLNPAGQPSLRVNRHYARLAQGRGAAQTYLRDHLREARWLLHSLKSRAETMLKVSECIVREQSAFLEFGPVAMRPLTMRMVADAVGMAESTISRVTTRKYLGTPRGTFELKYFFSSGLANAEGGETSSHAIRAQLKQLIAQENKGAPLSDQALSEVLGARGIHVARRTVAKYREAMNIPPSSERLRPS